MNINFVYIISQILVVIYYIIYSMTFQLNDRKKILLLGCVATLMSAISYILLGAYTGMAMCFVAIIRNLIFANKKSKNKISYLILINSLILLLSILTYNNVFSLLDVFATIIYTYSLWNDSTKNYKLLGIIVNILMLGYDISLKSIFGVIFVILSLISSIIGYFREK